MAAKSGESQVQDWRLFSPFPSAFVPIVGIRGREKTVQVDSRQPLTSINSGRSEAVAGGPAESSSAGGHPPSAQDGMLQVWLFASTSLQLIILPAPFCCYIKCML